MQIMSGESLFGNVSNVFDRDEVGFITYARARGKVWMFVSAACILVLAFMFMVLAAWKVNPMNSVSGHRNAKKKAM